MDFPIQIKAIRMGLSIIYFKGSQVGISHLHGVFLSLNTLTNSVNPKEMPHILATFCRLETTTVLPTKSDSNVMFYLQSCKGLRMDRSLVY